MQFTFGSQTEIADLLMCEEESEEINSTSSFDSLENTTIRPKAISSEISLETMHPIMLHLILRVWYGAILVGLIMLGCEWKLQWHCLDMCRGSCPSPYTASWNSSDCMVWENALTVSWKGMLFTESDEDYIGDENIEHESFIQRTNLIQHFFPIHFSFTKHNRFAHLFFSLPHFSPETRVVPLLFMMRYRNARQKAQKIVEKGGHQFLISNANEHVAVVQKELICRKHRPGCDTIRISLVETLQTSDFEFLSLKVKGITPDLAKQLENANVGFMYRRNSYTQASLVIRYVVMLLMFIRAWIYVRTLRLSVALRCKTEQAWVLILIVIFFLYVNPLHVTYMSFSNLSYDYMKFMELHVTQFFHYTVQAWMLILVSAVCHAPEPLPLTFHAIIVLTWMTLVGLDITAGVMKPMEENQLPAIYAFFVDMNPFKISARDTILICLFSIQIFWLIFGVLQGVWVYYSLRKLPYLETRSQQLSFRFFLFVIVLYVGYFIAEKISFLRSYNVTWLGRFRHDQIIGDVLISYLFVQIAAHAYGRTRTRDDSPPHPYVNDWKVVLWSPKWYDWLRKHGGSLYFFTTRKEKRTFERIQREYYVGRTQPEEGLFYQEYMAGLVSLLDLSLEVLTRLAPMVGSGNEDTQFEFFCLETAIECYNLSWEVYLTCVQEDVLAHSNQVLAKRILKQNDVINAYIVHSTTVQGYYGVTGSLAKMIKWVMKKVEQRFQAARANEEIQDQAPTNKEQILDVEQHGYELLRITEREGVQAMLCGRRSAALESSQTFSTLLIAFRGTCNQKNVETDMNISRSIWLEMVHDTLYRAATHHPLRFICWDVMHVPRVHQGFLLIWMHLREVIISWLSDFFQNDEPPRELLITGHSLGGAVAMLCAYSLTKIFKVRPIVYTFGSPRLGNKRFQELYDVTVPNTFRVVNEDDLVTRAGFLDNPHAGREIAIDRYGNIICNPTFIERTLRPVTRSLGLQQHLMESYAHSLNAVADRVGLELRARAFPEPGEESVKIRLEESYASIDSLNNDPTGTLSPGKGFQE